MGKSWGWPCEGSAEIQKALAGDHRKEDHVQGLFPGALVLLALLSKEEWKLWMVSCKICLSRPCGRNWKQTQKVLLNLLTINSIDTVLLMLNSYSKKPMGVLGKINYLTERVPSLMKTLLSQTLPQHPQSEHATGWRGPPRYRSPIPRWGRRIEPRKQGWLAPKSHSLEGRSPFVPCSVSFQPLDFQGIQWETNFFLLQRVWTPCSPLPKISQIPLRSDSPLILFL